MRAVVRGCLAGAFVIGACGMVSAQETKSAALAKQLASALTAAKLDSVAAKDPVRPNGFVAALHIAGVQLLVIASDYPAPTLLEPRLAKGEYRPGFLVSDLSGNIATKQIPVMVDVPDDGSGVTNPNDPNSHANGGSDDTRSGCVVSGNTGGDALFIGGALFGLAVLRNRRKKK